MECREAIEYINLYVDSMLSQAETELLAAHINSCTGCKKELEDITALKRALEKLDRLEPPAGLAASAVRKAKRKKIPVFAYASAGIAAAIALVAIFSSGLLNNANDMSRQKISYSMADENYAEEDMDGVAAAPQAMPEAASAPMPESAQIQEPQEMLTMEAPAVDNSAAGRGASESYAISVPVVPENSDNVRELIESFIEKYDIEIEQTDDSISFVIPEQHMDELMLVIEESGIEFEQALIEGYRIEFIFR